MKLTKEDLDKVRNIEGFPIGKDEDIIALSRPPYYTACPNPFIKEFIEKNGTPYDEETDDYHCEPFAADVSEGKNDPIYMAHSYHTKVPYKAIMQYILHYTEPGDVILDGFCGTGMAGVAAQMCGCDDNIIRTYMGGGSGNNIKWGRRKAVLNDISTAATFIASNYNTKANYEELYNETEKILTIVKKKLGWMYKTTHVDKEGNCITLLNGELAEGCINYVVWSDVFVCPSCSKEIIYWDLALSPDRTEFYKYMTCPYCSAHVTKSNAEHAVINKINNNGGISTFYKQVPVLIVYSYNGKKYEKKPDYKDLALLKKIDAYPIDWWYPKFDVIDGEKTKEPLKAGISTVDLFYTRRNLIILSCIWNLAENEKHCNQIKWVVTSILIKTASKLHNIGFKKGKLNLAGAMPNALFIPSILAERNVDILLRKKLKDIKSVYEKKRYNDVIVSCNSTGDLSLIPDDSIDYIFTDPPFGKNLNYSELNFIWEAWLKNFTNTKQEAIIHKKQGKGLAEYQGLMEKCLCEYYRVLKPNRWITVEFHNSHNSVWNAIQEAIQVAGFIVADVRTINKKQGSYNQMTSAGAVKQDLVITAYKPKKSFVNKFNIQAGTLEMVWEFVSQHLDNMPIVTDANNDGKIDIIFERCDYLLFDRMVAYHIMNGIPVPMDAHTFYDGLRQRFIERDGMFFNSDQVNEYDEKRLTMEVEDQQMALFVTDEKNAIAWLHQLLDKTHLSYQEIQPKYLQELHQDKREEIPELLDMLKENFVQDVAGKWYIPDLTDAADLAKLRRKKLLKEFYDSYAAGKQKIKVARQEAIRAGFDDCWAKKDYATIVHVGDRLPEAVLQEDQALLMYYDNASSRV